MNGVFITLEGIDGSGKSTQARLLAEYLTERLAPWGRSVFRTSEPGNWPGGLTLRDLLLHGRVPDTRSEFLLFLADRSAHVATVICPELSAGKILICERYTDSTLAYQVYGRGFNKQRALAMLNVCGFPEPDLTVFLRISPDEAMSRIVQRGQADRIESNGLDFMRRVADGFDKLASESSRALIVDASKTAEEVAREIQHGIEYRLGQRLERKVKHEDWDKLNEPNPD